MALTATDTVEEARIRHHTAPLATAALGRTLMAAMLLAAHLKSDGSITLRILGDGPLGAVIATASHNGIWRGYIQHPEVSLPLSPFGKLDVGRGIGQGSLYVSRDQGHGEPYTSADPLVSGEIGEDLAYYLHTSEQIPSAVSLGVRLEQDGTVAGAGAVLLQVLPSAPEETPGILEERLMALGPVSSRVAQGISAKMLLEEVLAGLLPRFDAPEPLAFRCNCSRERSAGLLKSLGKEELAEMVQEGKANLVCHFCGEEYLFSKQDLWSLLQEIEDR